ncbi:choice-of-anchor Q domain-containing protein [Methylomagnum ishizawai]|uniref:choice-of-anchor Q domain-containing protein n=1 Tax=Methylomagnum ishizawai TaxID=1760988 RepID=UPI001C32F696|nr:choice-of-anchor Q domain-containing protein [Methylomagnum ishizawai]BBL77288.1 hypothetical protein MishRS11D_43860 [Methylomagnum ishizawai]
MPLLFAAGSGSTTAATIIVNGTTCGLVDAIAAANRNAATNGCPAGDDRNGGGDIIDLRVDVSLTAVDNTDPDGVGNGLPAVVGTLTVNGNHHTVARAAGAPPFRLFDSTSAQLTLNRITVKGGDAFGSETGGGGIKGTVTLNESTVTGNQATWGGGIYGSGPVVLINSTVSDNLFLDEGGGIYGAGPVTLQGSTVSGNKPSEPGFNCAYAGGGIYGVGAVTLTNSTVFGNEACAYRGLTEGGGVYGETKVTLIHSTVTFNQVYAPGLYSYATGGGVYAREGGVGKLINSIVADNSPNDIDGACEFAGLNLVSDNSCNAAASGQLTGYAGLAGLADNGGPTQTQALTSDSQAVDRIVFVPGRGCANTGVTADQRGLGRPQPPGGKCDIGAFEYIDVLDDFNRPDGALRVHWSGSVGPGDYMILNGRAKVRSGGPAYWKPTRFGVNAQAFVTLAKVNQGGFEHGLMLKVQSTSKAIDYRLGVINVDYRARDKAVLVSTLLPNGRWKEYPLLRSRAFGNGDRLGALVYGTGSKAGTVHVYKNGVEVGAVALDRADRAFFDPRGGYVGLWFGDAAGAEFDDFGGGNVAP